jgi:hypothetical protein
MENPETRDEQGMKTKKNRNSFQQTPSLWFIK